MNLKNIAKFDISDNDTLPLETRVAHQIIGTSDKNGKLKNP